jgi:sigma-E factor negative regulatory protein RseC
VVELGDFLRELGRVTEVSGSLAKVIVKRRSSCESCGLCGIGGRAEMSFILKNDIGAQVGDGVLIEMRSKALFKAAFLVYTVPLATMVIGFLLGQSLGLYWGMRPDPAELFGIGTGFFFLVFAFLILRRLDRSQGLGSKLQPQLVAVVGAEDNSC